jgi:CheY-like chemotaxis protein
MFFDLNEGLTSYLMPFLIGLALAVLLFLLHMRRSSDDFSSPPPKPRVPAAPPVAAPAPVPVAAPPPPPAVAEPAALLLVDDSAVARAKLSKLFLGAGYRVTVAKDGVDALERLAEQRFALMITDLEMPNKDGFELIAAVQGDLETEDMPVIAITGHDDMQARVHQVQGLYGIFKKPWNDRDLLKRVETLVGMRKG